MVSVQCALKLAALLFVFLLEVKASRKNITHSIGIVRMDIPIYLYVLGAVVLFGAARKLNRIGRRPADFPPGPPTLPILGNIHQVFLFTMRWRHNL